MSGSVLDSSIPLRAVAPAPVNPLTSLAAYQGIANSMAQNRLMQQGLSNAQLANQQGQVDLQNTAQGMNTTAQNRIAGQLGTLINLPESDLNFQAVKAVADKELASGTISQQQYDGGLTGMSASSTPQQIRQLLTQHLVGTLAGPDQMQQIFGTPVTVTNGRTVQGGVHGSAMNGGALAMNGPAVPTGGMDQSAATAPTQIGVDPVTKAPLWGTRQQFIDATGGGAPATGPLGTGRLPAALRNPNAAPPAGAPATAAPGIPMGVGPAQAAALTTQGNASAKAFADIADQGVAAKSQSAVLGNMLGDTAQFTSGPAADAIGRVRAIAGRLGLSVDTEGLTALQSFQKLAAQLNNNQGSDARLSISEAANPHADLSPGAVDQMLRQLQGNADYNQARAKLAATYPDQSNRAGFESGPAQALDPRAFQFARLTQPERQTYANSLSKDDRDAVKKAYNSAVASGLIGGAGG